jgi:hypothetical protein
MIPKHRRPSETIGCTYNDGSIDPRLQHARRISLLLARLALADFGRLAGGRQAQCHICYLQHGERCKNAEQGGDGVGHDVLELVCIQREDDDGVHVGVDTCHVILQGLNGCRHAGLGFGRRRGVDGDFAGHVDGDQGAEGCRGLHDKRVMLYDSEDDRWTRLLFLSGVRRSVDGTGPLLVIGVGAARVAWRSRASRSFQMASVRN